MEHLHRGDDAEKGSRLPVANEDTKCSLKEEITCGAPQGSRVCPLVWNVTYDDFLRMDLPARTSIIGFADDALVVCAADDVGILELRYKIKACGGQSVGWIEETLKWPLRKPRFCSSRTGDPFSNRASFSESMRSSGEQV